MSVTQTITTVLPSKEIEIFSNVGTNITKTIAFTTLINRYMANDLITSRTTSEEGLTHINTRTFVDEETFNAFMAEPDAIAFFEARSNYNTDNNIISTIVIA
jgi:hypothetical protein